MPHFFDRKETGRKETPRPPLRSLINCICSNIGGITHIRSDKFRLVAFSHNIYCSLREGREFWYARRSFRRAKRFAEGKTCYHLKGGLLQYEVLLKFSIFLFLWFCFFLCALQAKRKK